MTAFAGCCGGFKRIYRGFGIARFGGNHQLISGLIIGIGGTPKSQKIQPDLGGCFGWFAIASRWKIGWHLFCPITNLRSKWNNRIKITISKMRLDGFEIVLTLREEIHPFFDNAGGTAMRIGKHGKAVGKGEGCDEGDFA